MHFKLSCGIIVKHLYKSNYSCIQFRKIKFNVNIFICQHYNFYMNTVCTESHLTLFAYLQINVILQFGCVNMQKIIIKQIKTNVAFILKVYAKNVYLPTYTMLLHFLTCTMLSEEQKEGIRYYQSVVGLHSSNTGAVVTRFQNSEFYGENHFKKSL
jgi:hypothetical protein